MSIKQDAVDFLHTLIGKPLLYAIKSPDTELYDFGFGELVEVVNRHGKRKKIGTQILHALCRFKVIWRIDDQRVDVYYEDTPCDKFYAEFERLIGMEVRRIELSDKNDLWLDFGTCWVVFATFENEEESWRFFTAQKDCPHVVAADSWLEIYPEIGSSSDL